MIYLDNAALQRPKKEVIEVVNNILTNNWHNPSSIYEAGINNKKIIEHTRSLIANEINCDPLEIIFCGSGSEANTLAIDGWFEANKYKLDNNLGLALTNIEHSSIIKNRHIIGEVINCDTEGFVYPDDFKNIHDTLVSIGYGNGEIGTISNIKEITKVFYS